MGQAHPPYATLVGDDGRLHRVAASALVGRSPTMSVCDGVVSLIVIDDDDVSLSKSHAWFRFHEGRLWVRDNSSRNGTTVSRGDTIEEVAAESWTLLEAGDRVYVGGRWLAVGPMPAGLRVRGQSV